MGINNNYASWVTGKNLRWAVSYFTEKQYWIETVGPYKGEGRHSGVAPLFIGPERHLMEEFLSREESGVKIHTMETLILNSGNTGGSNCGLNLLWEIRPLLSETGGHIPATNTKEINHAVDKFKIAVEGLFKAIGCSGEPMDLIENLSGVYEGIPLRPAGDGFSEEVIRSIAKLPSKEAIELTVEVSERLHLHKAPTVEYQNLINLLDGFCSRETTEVLFDYADRLSSQRFERDRKLFQVNKGRPSLILYRVRALTYALIDSVGFNAVESTEGLYSLIAYLVGLSIDHTAKHHELLQARDVSKQVKAAIVLYKKTAFTNEIKND